MKWYKVFVKHKKLPLSRAEGMNLRVRPRVNVSYFNYFSLLVHRFAVRITLPFIWYCMQAVFTDPGTYNWGPVYTYPFLFENGVFSTLVSPIVYM